VKVYLAARFSDRAYMELVADKLTALGVDITARWVYGGEAGKSRREIAVYDIDDVDAADTVVSFTQPIGTMTKGGGRHVEFGYGLAKGKRLILIGARENVFHHYPNVAAYPSLDAWLVAEGLIEPPIRPVDWLIVSDEGNTL
jgi:nucleoside 2-deoxyribosyltransferase